MLQGEGVPISAEGLHEAGLDQADSMVEIALQPDESRDFARRVLYRNGFQRRHDK